MYFIRKNRGNSDDNLIKKKIKKIHQHGGTLFLSVISPFRINTDRETDGFSLTISICHWHHIVVHLVVGLGGGEHVE